MITVSLGEADFDAGTECARLRQGAATVGAVAQFVGVMRGGSGDDELQAMILEHYPGMTEGSLRAIAERAGQRWSLQGVTIIHRVGEILPGEQIVLVAVASRHRGEAFAACEFIMDFLKTEAPFWKKEIFRDGRAQWVDARDSDSRALDKWTGA